jgi:hypothetical protein
MLVENGIQISFRTILRCRTALGWTFRVSTYRQLIREANKIKRLDWSQRYKEDELNRQSSSKVIVAFFGGNSAKPPD